MKRSLDKNGQPLRKTHEPATGDSSNGKRVKGAYVPTSVEDVARFKEITKGARFIE